MTSVTASAVAEQGFPSKKPFRHKATRVQGLGADGAIGVGDTLAQCPLDDEDPCCFPLLESTSPFELYDEIVHESPVGGLGLFDLHLPHQVFNNFLFFQTIFRRRSASSLRPFPNLFKGGADVLARPSTHGQVRINHSSLACSATFQEGGTPARAPADPHLRGATVTSAQHFVRETLFTHTVGEIMCALEPVSTRRWGPQAVMFQEAPHEDSRVRSGHRSFFFRQTFWTFSSSHDALALETLGELVIKAGSCTFLISWRVTSNSTGLPATISSELLGKGHRNALGLAGRMPTGPLPTRRERLAPTFTTWRSPFSLSWVWPFRRPRKVISTVSPSVTARS